MVAAAAAAASKQQSPQSQNPLTRVYESNGPDVKIRGTASHIAEKYMQLARDAQLRRSGRRRELLPARRTLFSPDRHGAGTVPAAESLLQQSGADAGAPTGAADDNYTDGDDDASTFCRAGRARLRRRRSRNRRRSLICRAMRSRSRRAINRSTIVRSISSNTSRSPIQAIRTEATRRK